MPYFRNLTRNTDAGATQLSSVGAACALFLPSRKKNPIYMPNAIRATNDSMQRTQRIEVSKYQITIIAGEYTTRTHDKGQRGRLSDH